MGGYAKNLPLLRAILRVWADGMDQAQSIAALATSFPDADRAVSEVAQTLRLWTDYLSPSTAYVRDHIETHNLATRTPRKRMVPSLPDGHRGEFQRDHDRLVWSRGVRQLANKTQVFPGLAEDFLRHRLSHSLEVAQLARTIANKFSLDPFLVDAGGLAHDIGHTPFGHAGEDSLDSLFDEIHPGLGGFNHYEHGVDVVRWLEDAYQPVHLGGLGGLNLTGDVADCIFKHTYCHDSGHDRRSLTALWARTKHQDFVSKGIGSLEAQAVRLADKISYLISDLEDGIRAGAITEAELLSCALLRRAPLSLRTGAHNTLAQTFAAERSALINIVMKDALTETARRLVHVCSRKDVNEGSDYTVSQSRELQGELDEVWAKLQSGKLHKDARVQLANARAAVIVKELTALYAVAPECLPASFVSGHRRTWNTDYMAWYLAAVGKSVNVPERVTLAEMLGRRVETQHLVMAKDFVAGLSDERAVSLHRQLVRR